MTDERNVATNPWAMWFRYLIAPRVASSSGDLATIPTGLTLADAGYLFEATDFKRVFRWTGTAWEYAPGQPIKGEIVASDADPLTGWALCDGSVVTRTKPDATTESFTTPNLVGRYPKGVSTYTGVAGAAVAPGVTGTIDPAGAHSHGGVTGPSTTSVAITVGGAGSAAVHPHTHVISAELDHVHGVSGLTADNTGEPPHFGLLFFTKL
jgi:hypothetical protein